MQFYLDLTANHLLKIMCSYCFSQFQAAGSGGRSLPVHHPVLHHKDRGSDGQRRLPHCLVCHHCHGVPGQRGHHLREFLLLARPSGGQKPPVHAVVLGRPFQSDNGLGGGPKDNIILCTYSKLKTKSKRSCDSLSEVSQEVYVVNALSFQDWICNDFKFNKK